MTKRDVSIMFWLCVAAVLVASIVHKLETWADNSQVSAYCKSLGELSHYETKTEAGHCWIKLGDGEYDSRWIPAEWMNVG